MSHSHDGHMFGSTDHADSAGQPWEGREFEVNPFANDDGTTPAHLQSALDAFRALPLDSKERSAHHVRVIDAIRTSRFLVPLLAEAGDVGVNSAGLVVDKTQELAIVTVSGPNGQKVLPVFTCVEAMQAWKSEARPVPVEARRAALAAAADGAQWIVVNPKSSTEIVLRRPVLEAIAQGLPWVPNRVDSELQEVFTASISDEPLVEAIRLTSGDPDARGLAEELVVQIVLPPNLDQAAIDGVVQSLSAKWAGQEIISQRVDSMRLQLVPSV